MADTKSVTDHILSITPTLSSRFTLDEWHLNDQFKYCYAKTQQELSDRVLVDVKRTCESTAEIVKINKEETDYQLQEKLNNIKFRKRELLQIRKDVVLEIDVLLIYKERTSNTLKSIKRNALTIGEECLNARTHRLGIDSVHDDVEKELLKEREIIQGAENLLERILEEISEQIRRLKATLYYIDNDLENKKTSLQIDCHNITFNESTFNLHTCYGTSSHPITSVMTLNEWELQTNNNIISANNEVNNAKQLHCYIDATIKHTIDNLNRQKEATEEAFKYRIEQTHEAKTKLEVQHSEIVKQIAAVSNDILCVKQSIIDKEGYIALVHTRLGYRGQRPEFELVQDLVEANLIKEIHELRKVVAYLQQTLCEAETSLRYLLKTQIQLEEDINVKANTLKIDEVECTILRQNLDYHAY